MSKKGMPNEQLEPLLFTIRGHRVVLDADLARLYGVPTRRFNEAFRRSRHRFPGDFAFQLTRAEIENLRSQIAISSSQGLDSAGSSANWSQFVAGSHGGRRYLPWVFTEHGALMAANILRSERAVQTLLKDDSALRDLYRKLLPLLQPPPEPRKRSIGFHAGNG